jgi:hypothetical protein
VLKSFSPVRIENPSAFEGHLPGQVVASGPLPTADVEVRIGGAEIQAQGW